MNQTTNTPFWSGFAALGSLSIGGIILFGLLAIYHLPDKANGNAALTFVVINLVMLLLIATFSKGIIRLYSFAGCVQLWTVSVLYTVLQFGQMVYALERWSLNSYILYQLSVLLLFILISGAVIAMAKLNHTTEENQ